MGEITKNDPYFEVCSGHFLLLEVIPDTPLDPLHLMFICFIFVTHTPDFLLLAC